MPPELPWAWRQVSTPIDVTPDAFAQLVLENRLTPIRAGGYDYVAYLTEDGHDLYRCFADWDSVTRTLGATADPAVQTNPAAVTVPAGKKWLLLRLYNVYVADANVANRYCSLTITNGAVTHYQANIIPPITASQTTNQHYFDTPYINTSLATNNFGSMPPMELGAGSVITVAYSNKQAGDDAAPLYYVYKEVDA